MSNPFEKKTIEQAEAVHDSVASKIDDIVFNKKPEVDTEYAQNKQLAEAKQKIKKLEADDGFRLPVMGTARPKIQWNIFAKKPRLVKEPGAVPNVVELKPRIDIAKICMYLSVLGIVAVVMIAQSSYMKSPAIMILMMFFGMSCFLPMGLILGWLFLNINMRCKILRAFRGKNYGIVHFVLRGSQHLITRIMDFNGDIIVNEMRMWVIDDKGIHYIDSNGKKQFWSEVTSDHIRTLPANIPCLYLDYETMVPLKFYKEQSKSDPLQVGSTHLGYIANQIAKNLAFKKTMTLFYIIVIALVAINLVVGIQVAMWSDEMRHKIDDIQGKINIIGGFNVNQTVNSTGVGGLPEGNYTGG